MHGYEHWPGRYVCSLRDESGNIVGTLSAGENITERRRTERALNGQHEVLVLLGTGASLEDVLLKLIAVAEKLDPNVTCSVLMLSEDRHKRADPRRSWLCCIRSPTTKTEINFTSRQGLTASYGIRRRQDEQCALKLFGRGQMQQRNRAAA